MKHDLIIKNGTVILESGAVKTNVAFKDGLVSAIGEGFEAEREIDATGKIVSPGMVDTHVHIVDPGRGVRDDWEGYVTGTSACARGGVTSFLEMPTNQLPATADAASLQKKYDAGEGRLKVDVYSLGGLLPYNLDGGIKEQSDMGVIGYKAFMGTCGDPDIADDMKRVEDYHLWEGMRQIAAEGKVLTIHAENASITDELGAKARAEGKTKVSDFAASRPNFTETEAVRRAIFFAEETGCPIHFVHLSVPEAVDAVVEAQQRGVDVTCETCPHYLIWTTDDLDDLGNVAKCSPPIRDQESQDGMWERLFDGSILNVTSDHSPCTPDMIDYDNAFDAWAGITGVQNNVDKFFDEAVTKRGMSLERFAEVIATDPAKRFGIKEKGSIAIGKHADVIIINPDSPYIVSEENYEYKNKDVSAYTGMEVKSQVENTFVRGHEVYSKENGVTEEFIGEFIPFHVDK